MHKSIVFLIDHPGLHLLLVPLMRALQESSHKVLALVCDHGVVDSIQKYGLPYVTKIEALQTLVRNMERGTIFVTSSDQQFNAHVRGRQFVQLAKLHGFATVSVQHAPFCLVESQTSEYICESSLLFTFGRTEYDFFRALGMEQERLVIVGSPKYDEILNMKRNICIPQPMNILVLGSIHTQHICCNYSLDECATMLLRLLRHLIKTNSESHIYIKPHPSEATSVHKMIGIYHEIIDKLPPGVVSLLKSSDSFYEYALQAKFAVSFSCSSIIELLQLNCPVLYVSEHKHFPTNRIIRRLEELRSISIMQSSALMTQEDTIAIPSLSIAQMNKHATELNNMFQRLNFMNDGKACARMVALLSRLNSGQPIETIGGVPKIFCNLQQ